MYIVVVSYSFDGERPLWIFDTEEEAIDCIRTQFEEEKRIEIEENERALGYDLRCVIDDDGYYAKIEVDFRNRVEVTEWTIGSIQNR